MQTADEQTNHADTEIKTTPSCESCEPARTAGARFCPQCGRQLAKPEPPDRRTAAETLRSAPPRVSASAPEIRNNPSSGLPAVSSAPRSNTPCPLAVASPAECICGRRLPDDSSFCPACGLRIGSEKGRGYCLHSANPDKPPTQVRADGCIIGKDPGCDVILHDDEFVSRRHARIRIDDGLVFLEDLGSSNGTLLRIRRPTVLEAGDEILIGTQVLRLELGR